jgi:hypothetical protein
MMAQHEDERKNGAWQMINGVWMWGSYEKREVGYFVKDENGKVIGVASKISDVFVPSVDEV